MRFIQACEVVVGGRRHFQIARQVVENPGHVRRALDIGMPAQRVHASAGASHVAQQQLQHRSRADDLCSEAMLRPSDRVNDGSDLLHVAIFADGREQVGGFQELIFRGMPVMRSTISGV